MWRHLCRIWAGRLPEAAQRPQPERLPSLMAETVRVAAGAGRSQGAELLRARAQMLRVARRQVLLVAAGLLMESLEMLPLLPPETPWVVRAELFPLVQAETAWVARAELLPVA